MSDDNDHLSEVPPVDISEYMNTVINEERKENPIAPETAVSLESSTQDFPAEKPIEIDSNLTADDLTSIILAEVQRKGLAGDHIIGMNTLYNKGLKQILTKLFKAEVNNMRNDRDKQTKNQEDQEIEDISFSVEFIDVELVKPTIIKYTSGKSEILTPNMARLGNLNYSAPIYATATITTTAKLKNGQTKTRTEDIGVGDRKWKIGAIPVMVKSEFCHLNGVPREIAKTMQEDPNDPGGYFILRGKEWAVDMSENMIINVGHGYLNNHDKEVARITFQSKPGDAYENSYYLVIKLLTDGQIIIQIVTNKTEELEIPYYLIFRAFGMSRDSEIIDNIVYGIQNEDLVTKFMLDILEKAYNKPNRDFAPILAERDPDKVLEFISRKIIELASNAKLTKDINAVKYVVSKTYSMLDKFILPHIGNSKEYRIRKLKFLGHLIHKLLRIRMGVLNGTDRDSCRNKRIHTAGVSIGKTLKTQINFAIITEIKKALIKEFKNTQWSKVPLADAVRRSVKPDDLERAIIQSIVTGEKTLTIKRNEIVNRVSSQQVYRKNDVNFLATFKNISTHGQSAAKDSERATDMRQAHNTYFGYIGMAQSADTGEKVGMNKQQAIAASITEASSSYVIKDILMRDPAIIHIDKIEPSEITSRKLTKIFVNGDWIALCEKGSEFVQKYRVARRHTVIWHETTIVWEFLILEIYFWTDVGRMLRPLIIVYNNINEFKAKSKKGESVEFKQWIKLNKTHITDLQSGKITIDDLRKQRVIEYVSPEESENLLIAQSFDVLKSKLNDFTMQYTHCDIEQMVFGLVELSAPNTNHTPASRITMFTNHKKQTGGWHALNWPHRIDKNTFLQYYCEVPTVRAFSNALTYPNAQNVILAYTPAIGYGQEDSVQVNKSAIDLGLFNGSQFYYEQTELEHGEKFGNPDRARTIDLKSNANYEYIDENGFIREGTIVQKGYVLIVKRGNLVPAVDQYIYTDRSVIYKIDEPAIVERVIYPRNDDDIRVAKVKLRTLRYLRVGDKVSSHSGCKGIDAIHLDRVDMPYCMEDGVIPDLILNPHSVPTRMVIGQIIETMMAELAVRMGILFDGTPFRKLDIDGMINTLSTKYGIKYGGHRRMINGKTGNYYDAMIFVGPTSYQRLQKFVANENYAMSSGPTCALTRQPLDGRSKNGGLRVGEMEKDVFASHGIMRTLFTKFYTDSDGIDLYICRCGNRATINEKAGIYKCKQCKDNADIVNVPSSYVANLFFNEINAMGVKPVFELEPRGYSKYE